MFVPRFWAGTQQRLILWRSDPQREPPFYLRKRSLPSWNPLQNDHVFLPILQYVPSKTTMSIFLYSVFVPNCQRVGLCWVYLNIGFNLRRYPHYILPPSQIYPYIGCRSHRSLTAICTRNELETQDRIPNKWKKLLRNKLVKSLSQAAQKYFRKRMIRHQRIMPTAIEISDELWWFWRSDNSELKFAILVPVTFWAVLYHQTDSIFHLCAIPGEMSRFALLGMQGAGHESESEIN